MGPLSETFLIVASFSALFTGLTCGLFGVIRHSVLWAIIATFAAGALVIWMLLAMGGGPGHLGRAGWIAIVVALGVVIFALLWASLMQFRMRRYGLRVAVLALFLPGLVALGAAFERQRLPDAACATDEIPLRLGQFDLRISPDFRADLVLLNEARERVRYASVPRYKEDRRMLCTLTDRGAAPLEVSMIWLAPGVYKRSLDQACASDTAPFYCNHSMPAGFRHLGSLQVMVRQPTTLRYEMSHAVLPNSDSLYFQGDDRNGEMCLGDDETSGGFTCRVWRSLDEDIMVLATGRSSGIGSHEYYLVSLQDGIDFMLAVMAR